MGRPEDERVKIPALIHLTRLEYDYLSLKTNDYDGDTNIFIDVFRAAVSRLNGKGYSEQEIKAIVQEFKLLLDADDLGRSFYTFLLKGFICEGRC